MNRGELEAALASLGPLGPGDYRTEVKKEESKEPSPEDPTTLVTVKKDVTYLTWVKPGTNYRLTVRVDGPDDYTEVHRGVDDSIKADTKSSTATTTQIEGTPDASKPGGFDNERPRWVTRKIGPDGKPTEQVGEAKEVTGKDYDDWLQRQGRKTPAEIKAEQDKADANARADRPVISIKEEQIGGKTYYIETTTPKDGKPPKIRFLDTDGKTEIPQLPAKPGESVTTLVTRNGKTYIQVTKKNPDGSSSLVHTDQDGNVVKLPDEDSKTGFAAEPDDAPPIDPTDLVAGANAYSAFLSARVKKYKDSGGKEGISPEDASKLMDRRATLIEAAAKEQQNTVSTQSGARGQDITQRGQTLGDVQSRRSAANSIFNQALSTVHGVASKVGKGKGLVAGPALQALLGQGLEYAEAFGGQQDVPDVGYSQYPTLAAIRARGQAGIATAAAGGPRIFEERPAVEPAPAAPAAAAAVPVTADSPAPFGPPPAMPDSATPVPSPEAAAVPPAVEPQPEGVPTIPEPVSLQAVPIGSNPVGGDPIMLPPSTSTTYPTAQVDSALMQRTMPEDSPVPGAQSYPMAGEPTPPYGAVLPVDNRPDPVYDAEGVDVTNSRLLEPGYPPGPAETWPWVNRDRGGEMNRAPLAPAQGVFGDDEYNPPPGMPGHRPDQSLESVPALPNGLQSLRAARYGPSAVFDPMVASAGLAARLGIAPEIMEAARRRRYGA